MISAVLPILRPDAGGFFGFGELDALKFDGMEGRFACTLKMCNPDWRPR